MAKKPPLPPPIGVERGTAVKIAAVLLVMGALYLLLTKVGEDNHRHQIERRIAMDGKLSGHVEQLKAMVAETERKGNFKSTDSLLAVYVGEVLSYDTGKVFGNNEPTRTLSLQKHVRLIGRASPNDTKKLVTISLKSLPEVVPKIGEWWVVGVLRDSSSNNVLHYGERWNVTP